MENDFSHLSFIVSNKKYISLPMICSAYQMQ